MPSTTPATPSPTPRPTSKPGLASLRKRAAFERPFFCLRPRWYFGPVRNMILCLGLVLCSCREQGPPAPTAEQADQLNDAEDMLNAEAANDEGPADRSAGPSNASH